MDRLWRVLGIAVLFLGACDDTLFNDVSCVAVDYEGTWEDVTLFFEVECNICHRATGVAEFSLEEAIEEDVIDGTELFVVSGDAEASLLWQVLIQEAENPMPASGRPLPMCLYEHIGDWIDAGAMIP